MGKASFKKAGNYYPCGKLRPETASPAMVRRIIAEAKRGAADPLFGSELGRLRLTDVLNDKHVAAGTRYAEVCGIYDRLKGMPSRSVKSPSYEAGYGRSGGNDADDESVVSELLRNGGDVRDLARRNPRMRAIVKATIRHDEAHEVLKRCGYASIRAVRAVVLDDEMIVAGLRPYLITGLEALHEHFKLTAAWN